MSALIVNGTIAPYIWTGNSFVIGPLIDTGVFGPVGESLTGDPLLVVWHDNPITADLTINNITITFPPASYSYIQSYVNDISGTPASAPLDNTIITYDYTYAQLNNPLQLGGAFDYHGIHGYFYVDNPANVPGPIIGNDLVSWVIVAIVAVAWLCSQHRSVTIG